MGNYYKTNSDHRTSRMERVVREHVYLQIAATVTPQQLVNIHPVVAAIKKFFRPSPIIWCGPNKPIRRLTHKHRLSSVGTWWFDSWPCQIWSLNDVPLFSLWSYGIVLSKLPGDQTSVDQQLINICEISKYGFHRLRTASLWTGTLAKLQIRSTITADEDSFISSAKQTLH